MYNELNDSIITYVEARGASWGKTFDIRVSQPARATAHPTTNRQLPRPRECYSTSARTFKP